MVNFFEHQQQARRNTGLLVVLFFLAFALIIAAVTLVAAFIIGAVGTNGQGEYQLSWEPFIWVSLSVGGGILAVMLFKWLQLKAAWAKSLLNTWAAPWSVPTPRMPLNDAS